MTRTDPMLAVKALVVIPGCEISERVWRERRAIGLARVLAWGRLYPDDDRLRTITENIVADIGWPKQAWLDRQVAIELATIEANLAAAGR